MQDSPTAAQPEATEEGAALRPADEHAAAPEALPDVIPMVEPELPVATGPAFVYALGQIDVRFPSLGVEKELAQVVGRGGEHAASDRGAMKAAISDRQNRYLARGLCWVFTVEGLETYILLPRDPLDYDLLVAAVRDYPSRDDIDLVIGTLGGIAPPDMCNGLSLPTVIVDQIYSFDRETLVREIPTPENLGKAAQDRFRTTAGTFFDGIMRMADNAGATDEHRALNYLSVRYPRIYTVVTEEQERNTTLAGVDARLSPVSTVRRVIDVIFSFRNRQTDVVTKYLARVDVHDEHPFLMTPISQYYDLP
jgi:hypothetical protein